MFALSLIPFVFGYLITTRVLRERQAYLRLPVAYGLGLAIFLFSINILFHFLPLHHSVYVTVGLMSVVSLGLFPLRSIGIVKPRLSRLEAAVIIGLGMTACFRALFYQMKYVDDDVFPHAALMSLYLRDIFPPQNPLYPSMPYLGHYGRDLVISAMSVLFYGRFFQVQYVLTALNQGAIVLLAYFTSRRYMRSARAALLSTTLAFLGGWALMDVFYNNNSLVYLLLFLNVYLYWVAMTRRGVGSKIVAAVTLATYSIVYETHYGVLLIVFSILPLVLMLRQARWRARYLGISALIVGVSLVIAFCQGGTLTDVARRYVIHRERPAPAAEASALVTQEVSIRFPKRQLIITSFDGTDYPLMSLRLVREAGYFVLGLPAAMLALLFARRYWGALFALMALTAILVPATVDFGVHNVESYRFLFFGGLASAIVVGMWLGMWLDRLALAGSIPLWVSVGLVCILVVSGWGSFTRTAVSLWQVARRPQEYYWRAEEWTCTGFYSRVCDPADAITATKLHSFVRKGESIMIYVDRADPLSFTTDSMMAALSGAFVRGRGVRVSPTRTYKMGMEYMEAVGFRAIAFWNTGDFGILSDIGANYLLVDPLKLPQRIYDRLKGDERLKLILHDEDPRRGTLREVFKVEPVARGAVDVAPTDLEIGTLRIPSSVEPAQFYEIPLEVRTNQPGFEGKIRVGHRIRYGDILINVNDEIRQDMSLERVGSGKWAGRLFFVAPYEKGRYRVSIYVIDHPRLVEKAAFEVDVR